MPRYSPRVSSATQAMQNRDISQSRISQKKLRVAYFCRPQGLCDI